MVDVCVCVCVCVMVGVGVEEGVVVGEFLVESRELEGGCFMDCLC